MQTTNQEYIGTITISTQASQLNTADLSRTRRKTCIPLTLFFMWYNDNDDN